MIERHYTGREVAELLALDYETVLKKAHVGEIPSVRLGRLRRFPESGHKDGGRLILERYRHLFPDEQRTHLERYDAYLSERRERKAAEA